MAKVNVSARTVAYKSAIYGVLLFLIGTSQVTLFSKINILGATPDLLLGALVAIAMLDDEKVSAVCGIISGVIYVSLGTTTLPYYLIFSFLCTCVLPIVSRLFFGRNYPSYLALSVFAFALKAAYNLAVIFIGGGYGLFASLGSAVIPEFISSLLFTSVSYIILAPTARAINKRSTSRKEKLSK